MPLADWTGLIWTGKCRLLGTVISIEEGTWDDPNAEPDARFGAPYRVLCETHGDNRAVETLTRAERLCRHPWTWCHGCSVMRDELPDSTD